MDSAINAASNACIRDAKDEESRQICENFLERMSANDKELLKECIKTKRNQVNIKSLQYSDRDIINSATID